MPKDMTLSPDPPGPKTRAGKPPPEYKVFEDPRGRRRTIVVLVFLLVAALVVSWSADFWWRVHQLPPVSPRPVSELVGARAPAMAGGLAPSLPLAESCVGGGRDDSAPAVFAYLPVGDARAQAALATACGRVDAVLREALMLAADGRLVAAGPEEGAGVPAYLVARPQPGMTVAAVESLLLGQPGAARLADGLVAAARDAGAVGACLSLEQQPAVFAGAVRRLMSEWQPRARAAAQETCLIAGAGAGFWRDAGTVEGTDRAVLLAFEAEALLGAAAPRALLDEAVAPLARSLPADRLVLVPGSFGQIWRSGEREPTRLSYADAMLWADRHGAGPSFSADAGTSRAGFIDDERRRNQLWLLDAVSFADALAGVPGLRAVGLWPLGYEDPTVWDLLDTAPGAGLPPARVGLRNQVAALGAGPFIIGVDPPRDGMRQFRTGPDGRVAAIAYDPLPLPARIERAGRGAVGELALTFAGLPEPRMLPALVAALSDRAVAATFFATPDEVLKRADVAAALLDAGHGIGAAVLPLDQSWPGADGLRHLGLKRLQLQLADQAGRRSLFVRDAAGRLSRPRSQGDLAVLSGLLAGGFLPVAAGLAAPGAGLDAQGRLDLVRRGMIEGSTNLIDIDLRSGAEAVGAWLPGLIDGLAADGFAFVSLDDLADSAAPLGALPAGQTPVPRDALSFAVLAAVSGKLALLFVGMLSLDATRALVYLTLALQRRRTAWRDPSFLPGVTVLVPAYNEEAVIGRCLESLTRSDYPNLRILVIDDGSTDRTAEIVQRDWLHDRRITLIRQPNAGKCHAANHALEHVRTPLFVGIDADTIVAPDAISWLVQQFKDPRVGAVSGFVEVGNRCNYLTRAQAVEYIVSQAIARRAFDMFNGILVVPGAIGAWRTAAVAAAGAYSGNTITEDADLTVAIHRAGYRVRFEEHARAFTEAPVAVGQLVRQRIRWSLGMLQTSWKHRGAIRERRPVGFVSIVDAVWISLLLILVAPLVDVLMILLAFKALWTVATVGPAALDLTAMVAVLGYFSLIIVDTATAAAAFALERRRDWGLIALVPLMRIGYRQIIVFSALSALLRALTGRLYGWNKLSRTGTVSLPAPKPKPAPAPVLMPGE